MSNDLSKAAMAMDSPTSLASRRIARSRSGRTMTSIRSSDSESVAASVRSRRSVSLIRSAEDAELFDKMSSSTGVQLKINKQKVKTSTSPSSNSSGCSSPVSGLFKGAETAFSDLVASSYSAISPAISPESAASQTKSQTFFPEEEEEEAGQEVGRSFSGIRSDRESRNGSGDDGDDEVDVEVEEVKDLDLFNNNNSYYVLASLLVDFLQERVFDDEIVLQPEDADQIERILPESARLNFIESTRYRLQKTPAEPRSPIEFITLECQKLGLDRFGSENPILAALSMTTDEISLPVMPNSPGTVFRDEQEEEYVPVLSTLNYQSYSSSVANNGDSTEATSAAAFTTSNSSSGAAAVPGDYEQMRAIPEGTMSETVAATIAKVSSREADDDKANSEDEPEATMSETVAATIANATAPAAAAAAAAAATSAVASQPADDRTESVSSVTNKSDVVLQVLEDLDPDSGTSIEASIRGEESASVNAETGKGQDRSVVTTGQETIKTTDQRSIDANGVASAANVSTENEKINTIEKQSGDATAQGSVMERSTATTAQASFESNDVGSVTTAGQRSGPVMTSSTEKESISTTQQGSFETSFAANAEEPVSVARQIGIQNATGQALPDIPEQPSHTAEYESGGGSVDEVVKSRSSGSAFSVVKAQFTSSSTANNGKSESNALESNFAVAKETPVSLAPNLSTEQMHPDLRSQLEAEKNYLAESIAKSFSFEAAVEGNTSNVNITKQQLLVELREANKLMNNSVTPETTRFWQKHVNDLQARLSALKPLDPPKVPTQPVPPQVPGRTFPGDIAENNRRLLSEFQQRDQHFPSAGEPLGSSRDSSSVQGSALPLSDHDYDSPLVDVVSPADLPGGYQFEAEIEGQRFLATVPPGGVQQGETFTCYMQELDSVAIDIPVGYWKDDPQDVCKYGCFHPVVWSSFFCPLIPLSQIQTRVNLDFLGRPKTVDSAMSNRSMMFLVIGFWLVINLGLFMGYNIKWYRGYELSVADWAAVALINGTLAGFIVFVTQSTRSSIREKFLIREERWNDLEDLGCATMCLPCTVSQMSRHTANYDAYEAVCCSKTGLPDGVRVNQVQKKDSDYII